MAKERIHWNRIKNLLKKFGNETVIKMSEALITGGKGDSIFITKIKSYLEKDEENLLQLLVEMPDYAQFIEGGRRAGARMPPQGVLLDWMARKGIRSDLEYVIRKEISVRGIKPTPFLDIWYDRVIGLNDLIAETASEDLEEALNKFVKKYNEK